MPPRVKVRQIQSLRSLNSAIVHYAEESWAHIQSTRRVLEASIEKVGERDRYWHQEAQRLTGELQTAERALAACRAASARNNRGSDCSGLEAKVIQLRSLQKKAQANIETVMQLKASLNTAIFRYNGSAEKMRRLINDTLIKGSQFIRTKVDDLDSYQAAQMAGVASVGQIAPHDYTYARAKQTMLRRALDDPNTSRYARGWIRQELHRIDNLRRAVREGYPVEHRYATNIRMPPGLHAGHRVVNVNTPQGLALQAAEINLNLPHVARRLGLYDNVR